MQKNRVANRSKLVALSVYFLDNFALAVVYPIFTLLLFGKSSLWLNQTQGPHLIYLGILIAAFPFAQFIGAPIIGSFADRKGRKKAFFLTLIAETLGFFLSAVAIWQTNYMLLLFSRFFTGFFAANLTVCLAIYADLNTDTQSKTTGFAPLLAAGGFSFILAILIGGVFSNREIYHHFNPSVPFLLTSCLSLINLIIVTCFFKETGTPSRNQVLQNLYKIARSSEYEPVRCLYGTYILLMLAWMPALQFLSPLLYLDYSSTSLTITSILAAIGILWVISSGFLHGLLTKTYRPARILQFALPILALSLLGVIKPYNIFLFDILIGIAAVAAALAWVNNISLISIHSSPAIQGKVFGLSQSLGSLAMVFGPLISSYLGSIDLHLIYFFAGLYVLLAFSIFSYKK